MSNNQKIKNEIVRENRLEFLFELYQTGVEISKEDIDLLKKNGYISQPKIKQIQKEKVSIISDPRIKSDNAINADKHIKIVDESELKSDKDKHVVIKSAEGFKKITEGTSYRFDGSIDIEKEDWMPTSTVYHERDFIDWIDSINTGFQKKTNYKKFMLYVQQAEQWYSENKSVNDFATIDEKKTFCLREMKRSKENTLYFLNKYLVLKEGDMSSGARTYDAKPVHEVICYLFDCGYSMMIGKPRQIAATSTLGGCALKKILLYPNFFLKFITQDKDTGIEIFEDKIKYPFSELPEWLKPSVSNDRDNLFRLSEKGKKGDKRGLNSKLQVVAPSVSAINGGSPQLVMIDEAGYIGILGKMMREARPTMFWQNPDTKKIEIKRQIIAWGTGGEMDKAGKAYELEFMAAMKKWADREFESAIIPIFFDWTTRPGITKEFYDKEKAVYNVEGPDREEKMVQFRQTYPSIIEDMFLTSAKTLVSIDYINRSLERIRDVPAVTKPQKGYFEPVFDTSVQAGENDDVPFKIVGATFVPTADDDPRASCTIFMHPKRNWVNRYYSGVDPIASDNGYSNMSASIFDAHFKTVSAIVNYRDSNHKYTFLQTMLLGLYYGASEGKKERVKELVESNIGMAYIDYVDTKGFYDSLVYRTELPPYMQGGSNTEGIDNRGARTRFIINKMFEFIQAYGDNIWIDTFFLQLRTFICTVSEKGNETWGTADKRKFHDDVLFSVVFSYICSLSYEHLTPYEVKSEDDKYVIKYELYRDSSGNLNRRPIKQKRY